MPREQQKSREELISQINALLQQLEEDKRHLARPYADLLTFTLVPSLLFPMINRSEVMYNFMDYFKDTLQEKLQNELNSRPEWQKKISIYSESQRVLAKFEEKLISFTKYLCRSSEALAQGYFRIDNVNDEKTWLLPYQLQHLSSSSDQHLIFKMAGYVDQIGSMRPTEMKELKEEYINAMNVINNGVFATNSGTRAELLQQFPELRDKRTGGIGITVDQKELTTQRIADVIKFQYQRFSGFETLSKNSIEQGAAALANDEVLNSEYVVAICLALFAKLLFVNPMVRKVFPLNHYLSSHFNSNIEYNLLTEQKLQEQIYLLEDCHAELDRYVKRNTKASMLINAAFVIVGLSFWMASFLENDFYFLQITFACLILSGAIDYFVDFNKVSYPLDKAYVYIKNDLLTNKIKAILDESEQCFVLKPYNGERLLLSSIKITINKPYHELSKKIVMKVLQQTLGYFKINFLMSNNYESIFLPAQTIISDTKAVKDQFKLALDVALDIQRFKMQMLELSNILSARQVTMHRTVYPDENGLLLCEHVIDFTWQTEKLKDILVEGGFERIDESFVLNRNICYDVKKFELMLGKIQQAFKINNEVVFINCDNSKLTHKKVKPAKEAQPEKEKNTENNKKIDINDNTILRWKCGVTYPGEAVPLRGTKNKFIYWGLAPKDFGEHQGSYSEFESKSFQVASKATKKAGIKFRPTLSDCTGKLTLYPAHTKVPGEKFGDQGVVLKIERAETPKKEMLLIADGFEPHIHRGLKNS